MRKWYAALWLVRVVLVLLPQTAYIHPDEFFQTVEVVAGDILGLDTYTPWEFNSTSPIRSVTLPFTILGPPLLLFNFFTHHFPILETSYLILVLPRLVMVLLTVVLDLSVYYMCQCLNLNEWMGLMLVSSSYVTLTYLTRTFTNSFETTFLSLLLVVLIREWKSTRSSTILNFKVLSTDVKDKKSKKKFKPKKKIKSTFIAEIPRYRPYECITSNFLPLSAFLVGMIVVAGMFNRPTFLIFCSMPIFFWILSYYTKTNKFNSIMTIVIFSGLGFLLSFVIFVFVDSVYFNPQILSTVKSDFENCQSSRKDYVMCLKDTITKYVIVTPWNFIRYNTKRDNLAQHGIHPWYVHLLVNMPLLFGPMCVVMYYYIVKFVLDLYKKTWKSHNLALIFSNFMPLILLSYFPHQEPRFLIPLLPTMTLITLKIVSSVNHKSFLCTWIVFNLLLTLLFGFLHQGSLTSCIQYFQHNLHSKCKTKESSKHCFTHKDKFIFYHTYMPPRYLFLDENANKQIVDLQGQNWTSLSNHKPKTVKHQVYVILPGSLIQEAKHHLKFDIVTQFSLHLTMEDPPDLSLLFHLYEDFTCHNFYKIWTELSSQMSLFIIKIKR
ncbi:GPI mannosyltransferase 4-like [Ylistrum balloti]|uniref:GPI mannosyltransferase 4-like n=1 Tax=Ylistrum balloti TaxID=509963 RepID=UPI002905DD7A|nr:GPI mannosyltransferase 4-like [Ylistrum balloti]XP_060070645.1 GPI mannosyltransferase 4-like [Ylistrum balloti]